MKQFVDPKLLAPNVLTASVDPAIVREIGAIAQSLRRSDMARVKPSWNSDLRWISANSEKSFSLFEDAFDRLGIAAHVAPWVAIDKEVRLYAGFVLTRSYCSSPNFHIDWNGCDNQAFTLITPVSDNADGFGLLYERTNGSIADYDYRLGEAIMFGDYFRHSTKPGRSDCEVTLLCFTFGTDRMENWDRIRGCIDTQSRLLRQPDGRFVRLRKPLLSRLRAAVRKRLPLWLDRRGPTPPGRPR